MVSTFKTVRNLVVVGALSGASIGFIALVSCQDSGGSSSPPTGTAAANTTVSMAEMSIEGVSQVMGFELPDMGAAPAQFGISSLRERVLGKFMIDGLVARHAAAATITEEAIEQVDCSGGGTITMSCEVVDGQSVMTITASSCTEDNGLFQIRISGGYQLISDDPTACDTGFDGVNALDVNLTNLLITTSVGNITLARIAANGSLEFTEGADTGCNSSGGSFVGNYHMEMFVAADGEGDEGQDVVIDATGLSIEMTASQDPCREVVDLNGELRVQNRLEGETIRQTFDAFQVALEETLTGEAISFNGTSTLGCLGEVLFVTRAPIQVANDADCPSDGEVFVTISPSGETAAIKFNTDGTVDIDLGDDGSIDFSHATCDDISPACSG